MKDITINFLLLRLVATSSKGFLFENHDVLNSLTLVRKKESKVRVILVFIPFKA